MNHAPSHLLNTSCHRANGESAIGWRSGGRGLERALLLAVLAGAAALSACERRPPQPETSAQSTSQPSAATEALPGVKPHDEASAPASDRPGAVAIGAVEAGQSSGGANDSHAAPTAGDGTASGAASSPPR